MAQCKGCGREITWAVTKTGARIPLERCKHVYEIMDTQRGKGEAVMYGLPMWISHFLTCPKANEFSASNKNRQIRMDI